MRIDPASDAGKLFLEMGVPEEDLRAVRFLGFNWQTGGAVTLALPFWGAAVLVKTKYLTVGEDGHLELNRHLALLRHEMVHVRQRAEWGFLRYWAKQLWARVKTRSILAPDSDVEKPGYEAQAAAYKFLDERGIR